MRMFVDDPSPLIVISISPDARRSDPGSRSTRLAASAAKKRARRQAHVAASGARPARDNPGDAICVGMRRPPKRRDAPPPLPREEGDGIEANLKACRCEERAICPKSRKAADARAGKIARSE